MLVCHDCQQVCLALTKCISNEDFNDTGWAGLTLNEQASGCVRFEGQKSACRLHRGRERWWECCWKDAHLGSLATCAEYYKADEYEGRRSAYMSHETKPS